MIEILGGSLGAFFGLTLVLFGGASWMMGQAVAETWRNPLQMLPYSGLLAVSDRFLDFALFDGVLLSVPGLLVSWTVIGLIAFAGFRARRAGQMAAQYPWLFERRGPFSWGEKRG
ncbi:MAG: DUF6867 family protein [Rhodospirillales bacterium]|jgi:hypothetical protein